MLDYFAIWVTQPGPALLWTTLGFLVGALIGHYFALGRDKRKEFNEIADRVRLQLRREQSDIRAAARWAKSDDLNLLGDMAHPLRRRSFRKAVAEYQETYQQHTEADSYGQRHYTRTDHVEKAIKRLLSKLNRR
jgi:hypothetical protein